MTEQGGWEANRGSDGWNGRPQLSRVLRTVALAGRYGRLHRLAVDRLFADDGDRVLDLGCGSGLNTKALAGAVGREGRVVGVDPRVRAVHEAREEAARVGGSCSVIRGASGPLPFPDGAFDRAFSTLGVRAVPDVRSAVTEVARVVRPGGRFVVLHARPFPTLPLAFLGPLVSPGSVESSERDPARDVPTFLERWFDTVHVERVGGSAFVATAELSG
ncbi:class I SAM-dependent methyltransferase [Salinirubellus sp. GCM10025818]|uniref:class I SAM-dependent methyltransferase n=1 Tax=Salinirubellus TaxID=2162630 RepID=UPI0030D4C041